MRVCVTGKGGREHALAWAFDRAGHEVVVTPGSAGIPWSVAAEPTELAADLFVLGPDDHVVDGVGDRLRAQGKLVFGPNADGGRLEGSKAWMKAVLADAGVPTARFGSFTELAPATAFMRTLHGGVVVKTDYLALGKGVLVTTSYDEAVEDAGRKLEHGGIVVEECMAGPEASLFAICDGERAVALPVCQDHKRVGDGDTGPNTGGMGAYSPVPFVSDDLVGQAMERCVLPTLHALQARGIDYRGVLYAGLMLTDEGPKVVEYNVRFGDPEAQVLLPRFASDPAELLLEAAEGKLRSTPTFSTDAALTVALCSEGYPVSTRTGDPIEGIAEAEQVPGVIVFRAGVGPGDVTAGGRVLNVTALASTIEEARSRAYEAVGRISWPGMHFRTDIASQGFS
ncbi:MAG: phosphoribosylamine--glycine ligase [Actinomycetia bacterium]|nr:phosphoribosylamine--glycine ligase [Actinomycetes bacterium]